jgi:hypothetical protein
MVDRDQTLRVICHGVSFLDSGVQQDLNRDFDAEFFFSYKPWLFTPIFSLLRWAAPLPLGQF